MNSSDYPDFTIPMIELKLANDNAILPTREAGNTGFDMYISRDVILSPQEATLVNTDLIVANNNVVYDLQIRPRSSTLRRGIHVALGTIDSSYRGELLISAFNLTNQPIELKAGERIAQLVVGVACTQTNMFTESSVVQETSRGAGGFGSSGK
jgi:dUTP pyrophosphatase